MEISPMICSASQWTGFYMIWTSVMTDLICLSSVNEHYEQDFMLHHCAKNVIRENTDQKNSVFGHFLRSAQEYSKLDP